MRELGICGVRRGRKVRTTHPDEAAARPLDLVERRFKAVRPNQLWVTDLTYVATWAGTGYVCFIVDVFSRTIVGWRVATNMRTDMVLDALEMARWSRGARLEGLVCHSDAGSQFTSIRYGERLAEIGALPSIGSVGDSFEKKMHWPRPSTGSTRPSSSAGAGPGATSTTSSWPPSGGSTGSTPPDCTPPLDDVPPAEFEAAYYRRLETIEPVGIQ